MKAGILFIFTTYDGSTRSNLGQNTDARKWLSCILVLVGMNGVALRSDPLSIPGKEFLEDDLVSLKLTVKKRPFSCCPGKGMASFLSSPILIHFMFVVSGILDYVLLNPFLLIQAISRTHLFPNRHLNLNQSPMKDHCIQHLAKILPHILMRPVILNYLLKDPKRLQRKKIVVSHWKDFKTKLGNTLLCVCVFFP